MYLKLLDEKPEELLLHQDKPFYVYLSLTNICNANCIFCDVRSNEKKKCSIDVIKLIDELSDLGTQYIHFTGGGEPFINDEIFTYLEYATEKGLKINIISNGWNLDEKRIKKLSNYNIKSFFFSIDSHIPEVHDSIRRVDGLWNKVTTNINLIKQYIPNVKIVLNHVLNKLNVDNFSDFINLKKQFNFDFINPIIIKDCDELFFTKEQIEKYNKNLNYYYDLATELGIQFLSESIDYFNSNVSKYGDRYSNTDLKCIYPSFCSFIDAPTGFVYPCDCSIHRDKKIYKIGDLTNQSFSSIWNGTSRNLLKNSLLNSELNCKTKCDQANCDFNNCYFKIKERSRV